MSTCRIRMASARTVGISGAMFFFMVTGLSLIKTGHRSKYAVDHIAHIDFIEGKLHLSGFDLCQVEDIVDQCQQVLTEL